MRILPPTNRVGSDLAIASQIKSGAPSRRGFTLLEIMIAMGIFAMILTGIYATWMALMKGGDAAKRAAADVQRSRIALTTLHDALLTALMYKGNSSNYWFLADTSGDYANLILTSHLPASFPGMGSYGDLYVRRVEFRVKPGAENGNELEMTQRPILLEMSGGVEPYSMVLAKNVTLFRLSFYDQKKGEWMDDWRDTNQLPKLVQIGLGLGKKRGSSEPADLVTTIVSLPANAVGGELQGGGPVGIFPPGVGPPSQLQPGVPPGTVPPNLNQPGRIPGRPL